LNKFHKKLIFKKIRFADGLPELILSGKKTSTWRINDEKKVEAGDIISLCGNNKEEFAKALVKEVKMVAFSKMTKQDKDGHETYASKKDMLAKFSKYYGFEVKMETEVKIIKFKIID